MWVECSEAQGTGCMFVNIAPDFYVFIRGNSAILELDFWSVSDMSDPFYPCFSKND